MKKFEIKSTEELVVMKEGGKKLAHVKRALKDAVKEGVNAHEIELLARKLIEKEGAKPSFMMVPGYSWATCVNVNEGVVHGIPASKLVFKDGDIVSVDVGVYFGGFHTDTSFSVCIGTHKEIEKFLEAGRQALNKAIKEAKVGKKLRDISAAIEDTIKGAGYTPIEALVGHGIGRNLHEDPMIPCYTGYSGENFQLKDGTALAIEVMYTTGSGEVKTDKDGWTISTKDGRISALYEETVTVEKDGPFILTA